VVCRGLSSRVCRLPVRSEENYLRWEEGACITVAFRNNAIHDKAHAKNVRGHVDFLVPLRKV